MFILSYILILEVKHIHGFVHFAEYDQFMRVDTNIKMFPNPLEQCLRQELLLKHSFSITTYLNIYPYSVVLILRHIKRF
ncbi:NERD domain-containing protein [Geomicrobium sp. JCM 19055]|uniref:nuclease-related domain-containing protein n=1 Tax=Geomicrobium sp. JCM 19055 TaxID=1460649 RepID=UPI00187BF454